MSSSAERIKVMAGGLFSLILTMGIARFAYTPLLPVMQAETFLNDASGGWLATFNYMGYMAGALLAASISDLQLKDKLYRLGLIIAVVTTVGMALAENYWLWAIMRIIAGFSSAAGLLMGSGLILNWLMRHHHPAELGLHFGGVGLGIAASAVLADFMAGQFNWAQQWEILAAIGLILIIPSWLWVPRPKPGIHTASGQKLEDRPPPKTWMYTLYAAYFCAGYGYVISATFLVRIVENQPALQGEGNLIWLLTGLAAAPACIIWDRIARRTGQLKALFSAYALQIVGIALPALMPNMTGVVLGGLLYGGTFIGIVSLMLTMVGKFFPTKPAKPMGKLTLGYGVAQIVAPALSGMMAEASGNYIASLFLAAGIVSIGMLLLVVLHLRKDYRLPE